MVGASRFERPTSRTPSECATGLRHAPTRGLHYEDMLISLDFVLREFKIPSIS